MADSDEKPRKKLGLTPKPEDKAGGRKRPPARWSPLQRDRSLAKAAPAQAEARPERTAKPAGPGSASIKEKRGVKPGKPSAGAAGRTRRGAVAKAPTQLPFFAPCPRGLEHLLAGELGDLGAGEVQAGSGGVHFVGDIVLAWQVNLWSRLAIRVLQEVASGEYRDEEDLYRAAIRLPWSDWFGIDRTIAVRTVAHASPLKSLNFVALKIKDAVVDRFRQDLGARPSVDARAPQVPILLYLDRDRYSLYLDLSGEPLNRRGYRVEPAPAPLNENLAAGLLKLAGWTPDMPLLDPMMGGGTILLEAAMMALGMAPGLKRHFTFENLASFDKVAWTRVRKDAEARCADPHPLPIYGCDIDPRMIRAAGLNLKAAGLLDCVTLREGDVRQIPAPAEQGVIVTNPPYGVRLDSDAAFYRDLGDALKQHFPGWTAWLISSDAGLPKSIGLAASKRIPLFNGPLACRFYEYRMIAGSLREK